MRVSIREQFGLLVLFCSLIALAVLALATWFQNRNFVIGIRLSGLSLTASLKAAQLSSTILLYEAQTRSVSTRVLIQSALQRFYTGNTTTENWVRANGDLESALSNANLLIQASVVPRGTLTNETALNGVVNVTDPALLGRIKLPYSYPNGTDVYLGDTGLGYPPLLYPNLTTVPIPGSNLTTTSYNGMELNPTGALFLGPILLNNSLALISATTGIINNTSSQDVLGWLTVVFNASTMIDIRDSQEGIGNTGEVLIVGPDELDNKFRPSVRRDFSPDSIKQQSVRFILPPTNNGSVASRHSERIFPRNSSTPFPISAYPAVEDAWTLDNNAVNNAGAMITSNNEQRHEVSVGYAQVSTPAVDWVLLVEQSHGEVIAPIDHLRDVVLICVFCTMAGLMIAIFPLAHYSIAPIRNLRAATLKTVEPYQPDDGASGFTSSTRHEMEEDEPDDPVVARKEGFLSRIITGARQEKLRSTSSTRRRRTFRIPSKVPERNHFITDELTELTSTFNEMSDELTMQYQRLEERVKERTAELERSKLAAEAANQSKTLFIANISHELKTPLNGILGLTTVCMNEDDPSKVRSTLNTIYKSGDLLLHLLTDLLTFSKNEVGQQLSIDESEFRLNDLSTQLIPTFEKQAREGQVNLKVLFFGSNDAFGNTSENQEDNVYGPSGTGRVRDMCLWGDKNRILQVLMNFVSNGMKFTPPQGSVTVRIRCIGMVDQQPSKAGSARKSSMRSQNSKHSSKKRVRTSESSSAPGPEPMQKENTAADDAKLRISVAGGTAQIAKIAERRRSMSPPPLNTKDLSFEFEVEDTGPGIPDDQQKMIFEPFVQGDLGLSKKYGGTGLGLSICAQLAALMGGDISLDSKVGQGSRFTMKLPLRYMSERAASVASSRRTISKTSSIVGTGFDDSDQTLQSTLVDEDKRPDIPRIVGFTQPYVANELKPNHQHQTNIDAMKRAETEAVQAGRKVRVLVAEDNKINQEVVLRMLKLEDIYDVTIAKDGQEAFDRVRESMEGGQKYHLVFMDVQMPNVDGIQSTKLIRGVGFNAPIVALTAFAEKSNEDECMASGMDYFLAKPIRRPALKHVLKKYCATIIEEDGEISPGSAPRVSQVEDVVSDLKSSAVAVDDAMDVSPLS